MAWPGYFEYAGTEIINLQRVTAYGHNLNLTWLRPVDQTTVLGPMLGQTYTSPLVDNAPWISPDEGDSFEFLGLYPLDVTGLEDSTVQAEVTESVLDGGVVGRLRRATKTVVFSAALIGASECGVEYGMRWLKSALQGNPCIDSNDCTGSNLCYLSCEPRLGPGSSASVTACLDPYLRSLTKVSVTTGPVVTNKFVMPSGGVAWTVSFTMVAGSPFEFMVERPLINNFGVDTTPYVVPAPVSGSGAYGDGAYGDGAYGSGAASSGVLGTPPLFDAVGVPAVEYACAKPSYRPLYDPACPLVLAPPSVPSISVSCFAFPTAFTRRFFTIPQEEVPLYGQTVPIITMKTGAVEARLVRLRFYADVLNTHNPNDDPCSYCGDIVFSYIPAFSSITLDGVQRIVYVDTPGQPRRRADAVVFKSDGTPFDWPELTCGFSYLAVLDMPETTVPPTVDLSLVGKVA